MEEFGLGALTFPQTKFLHARGKPLESEPVNKLIDDCGQMPREVVALAG
jgi:hypothetical protein